MNHTARLETLDAETGSWDLSDHQYASAATPGNSQDTAKIVASITAEPQAAQVAPQTTTPPSGDVLPASPASALPDVRRSPIRSVIASAPAVTAALADLAKAVSEFKAGLQADFHVLHPTEAAQAARAVMATAKSAAEIAEAAKVINEASQPSAQVAAHALAGIKRGEMEPIREKARALVQASLARVEELKTDALTAETALFEAFNLPRESTGVYRRLAACQQHLRETLAGLGNAGHHIAPGTPPTGVEFDHVLAWFSL